MPNIQALADHAEFFAPFVKPAQGVSAATGVGVSDQSEEMFYPPLPSLPTQNAHTDPSNAPTSEWAHSPADMAVSNLQVVLNNEELSINWDAPEPNDRQVATGYEVFVDGQLVCAVEKDGPLCCVVDGFDAEKYDVSVEVATAPVPLADQTATAPLPTQPVPSGSLSAMLMLALLMGACGAWGVGRQRSDH